MSLQSRFLAGVVLPVVILSVGACGQPTDPQALETGKLAEDQLDWESLTSQARQALDKKDVVSAEKFYKQAIEAAKKVGEVGPEVASATSNLANFYYVQGDGEQADQLYQSALSMREKTIGVEHVDIAKDLVGLGRVYAMQNNYAKAEPVYRKAIDMLKKLGEPVPAEVEHEYSEIQTKAKTAPDAGTKKGA